MFISVFNPARYRQGGALSTDTLDILKCAVQIYKGYAC